jgi:hypothetical protein
MKSLSINVTKAAPAEVTHFLQVIKSKRFQKVLPQAFCEGTYQDKRINIYIKDILAGSEANGSDPNDRLQGTVVHELGHAIEHLQGRQPELKDGKRLRAVTAGIGALAVGALSGIVLKQADFLTTVLAAEAGYISYGTEQLWHRKHNLSIYFKAEHRIKSFTSDERFNYPEIAKLKSKTKPSNIINNMVLEDD